MLLMRQLGYRFRQHDSKNSVQRRLHQLQRLQICCRYCLCRYRRGSIDLWLPGRSLVANKHSDGIYRYPHHLHCTGHWIILAWGACRHVQYAYCLEILCGYRYRRYDIILFILCYSWLTIVGEYPAGSVGCAESSSQMKKGTRNRWFILFTNSMIDFGFVIGAFVPCKYWGCLLEEETDKFRCCRSRLPQRPPQHDMANQLGNRCCVSPCPLRHASWTQGA